MTIVLWRFDYPKKVRNKVYLAMFYTQKLCFSRQKWKRPLVCSLNHNYESSWLRDLEQNGVQNAICVPEVNSFTVLNLMFPVDPK